MTPISLAKVDLRKYIEPPPDAHRIVPLTELTDRVIARAEAGAVGETLPWSGARSYLRFAPGQLTVWAGGAASFKSTILSQVVLGFAEQAARSVVTTLEEPIEEYGLRLSQQGLCTESPTREQVRELYGALADRVYCWDVTGTMKRDRALAMMRWCAGELKVNHFVFDNVTKVVNPSNEASTDQWAFIRDCHQLARDSQMHIHLVMHSRKEGRDGDVPTMNDVRGTSTIVDQADQIVMTWRNTKKEEMRAGTLNCDEHEERKLREQPDLMLRVAKAKFGGREGKIGLWIDVRARAFVHGADGSWSKCSLLGQ